MSVPLIAPTAANIPVLGKNQKLDFEAIRHPGETGLLWLIVAVNVVAGLCFASMLAAGGILVEGALATLVLGLWVYAVNQIAFYFFYWYVYGNSVLVSPAQYPELYRAVKEACAYLDLRPTPAVLVTHGSGLLEIFLVKRFTRRGILLFTSEMIEATLARGNSRELMMLVGRQLGHIKAGHFRWWFFKDVVGRLALWGHSAWRRRCHFTADRVGLLVAGDLESAQRGLIAITVGKALADRTEIDPIREQASEILSHPFGWFRELFLEYPYMVHRIIELESFRDHVAANPPTPSRPQAVAALPPDVNTFIVYGNAIIGSGNIMKIAQVTP